MAKFSFVHKDFHSPLVRNEIWTRLANVWPRLFEIPPARLGIISRKNAIDYIIDLESWRRSGEVLKTRIQDNPLELRALLDRSEEWGREMNQFTENIYLADLSSWSSEALVTAYQSFVELQVREYAIGVLLPLLDIGGQPYIETFVRDVMSDRVSSSEMADVYRILTSPTKDSFSLEQEKALLNLANDLFQDEAIRQILSSNTPQEAWFVSQGHPSSARITRHAELYGWVYYVYEGPAFQEVQFVEFLQEILNKGISPSVRLEELMAERQCLCEEQKNWIDRLSKNDNERQLLTLASEFVWSKPRRKDYQSKSYFHMEKFYREWARRMGVSLRHARSATIEQIFSGLRGEKIGLDVLESQYQLHSVTNEDGVPRIRVRAEVEVFIKDMVMQSEEEVDTRMSELQGSTAYPGKARGKVRIVNAPEDMAEFVSGEILVSIATTPSIVPAMKKAAAILTDEGGLTCHAAIVSRELKVPCIVGLRNVTTALKNGEEVKVDAGSGSVFRV